jgi:hypothetical protein
VKKVLILVWGLVYILFINFVFAWHENLGISDESAQYELDFINMECIDIPTDQDQDQDGELCRQKVKTVSDNCFHHPGIDEECSNPKIQAYITKHNISRTYDSNYTTIHAIDPEKPTLKDSMQKISKNLVCKIYRHEC